MVLVDPLLCMHIRVAINPTTYYSVTTVSIVGPLFELRMGVVISPTTIYSATTVVDSTVDSSFFIFSPASRSINNSSSRHYWYR